jgi:hypothetical protein
MSLIVDPYMFQPIRVILRGYIISSLAFTQHATRRNNIDTHVLNVYISVSIQALNESHFITILAKEQIMYPLRMTLMG